jgi:hypothetical protein
MRSILSARRLLLLVLACLVVLVVSSLWAVSAFATRAPGWEASAHVLPTHLAPGGNGLIYIDVVNVGAANSEGPVTVTDVLPRGLVATDAGAFAGNKVSHEPSLWDCSGTTAVTCTNDPSNLPTVLGGGGIPALEPQREEPRDVPRIAIAVHVEPTASGTLTNQVSVAGGGAANAASVADPVIVSATAAGFGVATWDGWFSNEDGTLDTQAGSHPYAATFDLELNSVEEVGPTYAPAGGQLRNVAVDLPPGFVGDPLAVPQCPREDFDEGPTLGIHCAADTQIGLSVSFSGNHADQAGPVYNLVPPPDVAAEFGFSFVGNSVYLDSSPRTGGDYGITTRVNDVPEGRDVRNNIITLWGVPGDPSHNIWRCNGELGRCPAEQPALGLTPLLTLPTACGEPQPFTIHIGEWGDPSVTSEATFYSHDSNDNRVGFTGCEDLGFNTSMTVSPDTTKAGTPAGLTVEVKPALGTITNPQGLSTSDIQNTTVTLPEGLVINPGQAAGLEACPANADGLGTEEEPSCSKAAPASKVGTVQITTPLLKDKLEGNVYVLQSNPPNVQLLVAVSAYGVNVKLVGKVHLDEQTGQLTTKFEGTPELPFSDFKLSFNGGPQAALATPTQCGIYGPGQGFSADFNPWSSPFVADVFPTAEFGLTQGPGGGPCPSSPLPFAPSLVAGSTTDQAGGFTNFSLLLQRGDGQQRIERLQFKAPEGLSGMISSVPLCGEPQASQGTCSSASQIGHAAVASGPGPYPLVIPQPGQPESPIYLTGSYGVRRLVCRS